MNQSDALLRSIIENPREDLPRLIYADWLDEAGEAERAEFIRVQCELARRRNLMCNRCEKVQNKQRHFTAHCRGDVCVLRRREYLTSRSLILWHWPKNGVPDYTFPAHVATPDDWRRGFLRSVTLDWSSWLRHHAGLFWSSRQTVACDECGGHGAYADCSEAECKRCGGVSGTGKRGTGKVQRPFVASCQPLETVRLTTWPEGYWAGGSDDYFIINGYRFDRVKCDVCDGRGTYQSEAHGYLAPCSCRGNPLNLWECEDWPGVEFVMPE